MCGLDTAVISDEPVLRKRFMKKLTRDRVVPIMSAKVSWVIFAINVSDSSGLLKTAMSGKILAKPRSLELNNWSTKSAWVRPWTLGALNLYVSTMALGSFVACP